MLICLHFLYNCLHATITKLSSCDRPGMAHKAQKLLSGPLQKRLADLCPTPSSSFQLLLCHLCYIAPSNVVLFYSMLPPKSSGSLETSQTPTYTSLAKISHSRRCQEVWETSSSPHSETSFRRNKHVNKTTNMKTRKYRMSMISL